MSYLNSGVAFFHIGIFFLGLCIGSFVNVCIWRIPRDESIIFPPSHCPQCGYEIPWFDNIPVISWLLLKAKCRRCGKTIPVRYPAVELLTAFLIFLLWIKIVIYAEPIHYIIIFVLFCAYLVCVSFIDYDYRIIPDKLNYTILGVGIIFVLIYPDFWFAQNRLLLFWLPGNLFFFTSRMGIFIRICIAITLAGGFFSLCALIGEYIFKREALGWGDVKYIAAVAGVLGLPAAFFTILIGSLLGSIFGIIQILFSYYRRKVKVQVSDETSHQDGGGEEDSHAIPFGPFLAVATYIWLLSGDVLSYYLISHPGL